VHRDPTVKRACAWELWRRKELPSASAMAKAAGLSDVDAHNASVLSYGLVDKMLSMGKAREFLKFSAFTASPLRNTGHYMQHGTCAPGYGYADESLTKLSHLFIFNNKTQDIRGQLKLASDPSHEAYNIAIDHAALRVGMGALYPELDDYTASILSYPRF
jgi:hypothetical protein